MQGYNHITMAGNLTRDPELQYTPKGTAVCKFSIAVNRSWTSEAGEKKEEVNFFDVVAWGRSAENIAQYMRKGRPILIDGRLKQETWDDKQTGQKKSRVVIQAGNVIFLGSAPEGGGGQGEGRPAGRSTQTASERVKSAQAADPLEGDGPPESDDVPF